MHKQYEYEITHRESGKHDQARATADCAQAARAAIVDFYKPHWAVALTPKAIRPAHQVLGEIDCTGVAA